MTRPGPVGVPVRPAAPGRAPARVARGVLVGLVSGAGALLAHELAGSHAAPVVGLVVTVLAVAGGVAVARWRVGLLSALAIAAGAQAVSHLLLAGSSGHRMHAHAERPDAAMLLGHVGVALLTALLCRGADRVVLDLLRTLVAWFVPRLHLAPEPLARGPRRHLLDPRLLPALLGTDATPASRRGPPSRARALRLAT